MVTMKHIIKSRWTIGIVCLLLGAAVLLGIRFFTYKPVQVHYHANFALYVNGQREQFKEARYYTEVEMCTQSKEVTPTDRAHMHDNVNTVVHVEDHAVTWGQFFTNLGWTMGPTFIAAPDGTVYAETGDAKLHILLNGQDYTDMGNMANTVIKDQDKLLVSYGTTDSATLQQEYKSIPSTAKHYDTTKDPATCSGSEGVSMHDRLMHLF